MLAVEGCYWAEPDDIIILDFSKPMIAVETERWTDMRQKYRDSYPCLHNMEFEKWDGSNLVCKMSFLEDKPSQILISIDPDL